MSSSVDHKPVWTAKPGSRLNNKKLDLKRTEEILCYPRAALLAGEAYTTYWSHHDGGLPECPKPAGRYGVYFYQTNRVVDFTIDGHHQPLPRVSVPPREVPKRVRTSASGSKRNHSGRSVTVESDQTARQRQQRASSPTETVVSISVEKHSEVGVEGWVGRTVRQLREGDFETLPEQHSFTPAPTVVDSHGDDDMDCSRAMSVSVDGDEEEEHHGRSVKFQRTANNRVASSSSSSSFDDSGMDLDGQANGEESDAGTVTNGSDSSQTSSSTVRRTPAASSLFREQHPRRAAASFLPPPGPHVSRASSRPPAPMRFAANRGRETSRTPGFDARSVSAISDSTTESDARSLLSDSSSEASTYVSNCDWYPGQTAMQQVTQLAVEHAADEIQDIKLHSSMIDGNGAYSAAAGSSASAMIM